MRAFIVVTCERVSSCLSNQRRQVGRGLMFKSDSIINYRAGANARRKIAGAKRSETLLKYEEVCATLALLLNIFVYSTIVYLRWDAFPARSEGVQIFVM